MSASPLPRWLLVPAAAAVALVALPLVGMAARIPWTRLPELLTTPAALDALRLSLLTCLASTTIAIALGYPLALVLSRATGRWALAIRTLTVLPMVLPPVVAGLALLVTFGRRGLLGPALEAAGIQISFTTLAVVLAQTFVAMPFFVVSVESALRTRNSGYEVVAATLGARPVTVLGRVTTPLLVPALIGGSTLAFARSLGEFGATLTFAGSLQGSTRTLPLQIYLDRETDTEAALALSLALIALATLLVVGAGVVAASRRAR